MSWDGGKLLDYCLELQLSILGDGQGFLWIINHCKGLGLPGELLRVQTFCSWMASKGSFPIPCPCRTPAGTGLDAGMGECPLACRDALWDAGISFGMPFGMQGCSLG